MKEDTNKGTLTLDATCAPANICYPQDISLLNEAREKLEAIIYRFCKSYGLPLPRRYRRRARKNYLAFAKSKKHSAEKTGVIARSMESGCQVQSWAGQVLQQKQIKSKSIRIMLTESKWSAAYECTDPEILEVLSYYRITRDIAEGNN